MRVAWATADSRAKSGHTYCRTVEGPAVPEQTVVVARGTSGRHSSASFAATAQVAAAQGTARILPAPSTEASMAADSRFVPSAGATCSRSIASGQARVVC